MLHRYESFFSPTQLSIATHRLRFHAPNLLLGMPVQCVSCVFSIVGLLVSVAVTTLMDAADLL
eukprot:NODE_6403_length_630_cov_1536.716007_g5455_i0.p3 GENE.NODE_6403_length_630_cov_1536.716007_g5455_i0~~NODE_6403_length_630_cov_1536.716007_g5455_i0.p3  ORF type:complete len:63 (+),score=5.52 NODE_6403_length_630_cov_1536.716007_g5455_i0:20-208(+)